MTKDNRWRGRMPFRVNRKVMPEPLEQQGRGGEPSLANFRRALDRSRPWLDSLQARAEGSFTERLREAFRDWRRKNGLNRYSLINFEYRLSRHKRIAVTLTGLRIYHRPQRGAGSKGFMVEGCILSVNGLPPVPRYQIGEFAVSRIVGRHPVRLLTEEVINSG